MPRSTTPRPPHSRTRLVATIAWITLSGSIASAFPATPSPIRLSVEPGTIRLDGGSDRRQVAVTAEFADGSVRDITAEARFSVQGERIASVSWSGVVTPLADGEAGLVAEASGLVVDVPIEVRNVRTIRPASYRHDVAAVLSKAGCNMGPCHGNLNGKGGFRLSLRGDDPSFDLRSITREAHGRRMNVSDPDRSLLVLKPTGGLPHEGGIRFLADSPEAAILADWIRAGARDDRSTAPRVSRLTVWPPERLLAAPGLTQQLIVTAEFSDGSRRDVTHQATFDLDDPTKAVISPEGLVRARGPGEVTVSVRYLDGRGVSRLAFLHDRPDYAWHGPEPTNVVDEHVFKKLRSLKILPSETCSDEVFLRRAYLDALGLLPGPDEVRAFLQDTDPDKRAVLVDRLLQRPEFAEFWALKWADLLRNEEKTMGPKGVWVFQRWIRDQIAADVPLDEFAHAIIASRGSTWENPPASFYRTNQTAESAAEAVGQVFLGVRLQCARCHNHPFDVWTQDDYYGLAAHFANVDVKLVNNQRRDKFDKHEINGDVVIHLNGLPRMPQPRSGEMMTPKPLGGAHAEGIRDPDALDDLADWLTRDNRQFTRNLANRVWFHLMGRGIVDPVDDFRDSNPPSNPELLEALTDDLAGHDMQLRPLVRLIMTSATYALGSTPNETNADDEANFSRAQVRLLPAEVLLDAIGQALGERPAFPSSPEGLRAVALPGVRAGGEFLKVFGKPERLLTCECERSESTTLAQAFQLINGEAVRTCLESPGNRLGRLLDAGLPDERILEELYLATLGRFPGVEERSAALDHLDSHAGTRRAWEDLAWALVNSKEFLLRH